MTSETARGQAQDSLPDARREPGRYPPDLAQFVLQAGIGVVLIGTDGNVRWANNTEFERLGLGREAYVGQPYANFFVDKDQGREVVERLFKGEVLRSCEVTLRHASGAQRIVALDGEGVWDGDNPHARLLTRDLTEEKQSQEAARLRSHLLEAVGQAVIGTDPDGRVIYWNKAAEAMYGWSAAEVMGRSITDLTVPEDVVDAGASVMEVLAAGQTWSGEFRLRRRDGSTFIAYVTDSPLLDAEGRLTGIVGVSTDITALKAAQSALTARQRRLEAMADSLPAIVVMASQRQGFHYFNRAWYEFSGVQPDSAQVDWQEYIHPDDYPLLRDGFAAVLRGHTLEREARMRGKAGDYRWFLVRAVPLAPSEGEPGTAVISAVDITELKGAAQQIESSRLQLATVLGGIADGVIAQDKSGRLVYANEGAARLVGFDSVAEMLATPAEDLLRKFTIEDGEGRALSSEDTPWRRALSGEPSEEALLTFREEGTGALRYSLVKATPVFDADNQVEFGVSIFRDVTDQVAAEREREELHRREHENRVAAERVSRRLARLQATTSRLASAWTPQEAAETILDEALDILPAYAGAVGLIDDNGDYEIIAARGYPRTKVDVWSAQPSRMARPYRDVLATGEPVFVETREEFQERYPDFAAALGDISASVACLPLKAAGRTLGALSISFEREHALESLDRDFITSISQQCALALARTQLYQAERLARTQAEDAEARYRILAESIPQVVFTTYPDGTADYYSPQFSEFTGLSPYELKESDWHDLVHPDDVAQVREAWTHSLESAEPLQIEARLRRKDGSFCWILERAIPLKDGDDKVVRWLGTITDIHEQKRAEERYSFLAEASAVLSSSLEYEETLQRAADLAIPTLCDWCVIDLLDLAGIKTRLVIAGDEENSRLLGQAIELDKPIVKQEARYARLVESGRAALWPELDIERLRTLGVGEPRLALLEKIGARSVMVVPIVVRGKVTAAMTLMAGRNRPPFGERDLETAKEFSRHISLAVENALLYRESQRVQEELRLANETKDEFLGLMSHELRTPITTLYGGAKILRARGRFLAEEHKESLLRDIEDEAEGMHRMIEDLLVLARAGVGERVGTEPILANHLVDRVVRGFQLHRPGRQVNTSYAEDLLPVMADNTYMEQVLRNLLSNADKYSPAGTPIDVALRNEGEEVVVAVLDRGSGIDPDEAELIFNRFYRAERTSRGVRGMGLGLTVCKKLVEAQGGRIWARPRPDGGTEVAFALPAFTASYDDTL